MNTNELTPFIEKAQHGDTEAFGKIYDLLADSLFRYIRLKVNGRQAAEDLLQETFLKAWRGLPTFRLEQGGNFSAWMYRIASNTCHDHYRRNVRQPQEVELLDDLDTPVESRDSAAIDAQIDARALAALLAKLPAHYRTILELRYLSEYSIQETAKITGKSSLAVRLIQHRAVKKLQALINHDHEPHA